MAAPLLTTKLYIPPARAGLVPRRRLVDALNAGLGLGPGGFARKLTLISAPAGFGKTTLLSEWIGRGGRPVTWVSLDEGDNDPVRFVHYLVAALQKMEGNLGSDVLGLLGSLQIPLVEPVMTGLINDIAATSEPFVLVLDDVHLIHASWIHDALAFLLAHQPPQVHLILVTRQDPPLPLARLRVRDQVVEFREEDLRFTVEEAAAFLDQVLGLKLDAQIIGALEARTEGWIAGLQLAALAMQGPLAGRGAAREDLAEFVAAFGGSHRHVIDYLTEEVLARQPDDIREFLYQTSILDRFTASLCQAVCFGESSPAGPHDAAAILRRLEEANLFLVPLDDRREWVRYHRLFADFLRTELEQERQARLHLRAARWFEGRALWPEAVKHALASGDVAQGARMVRLAAQETFRYAAFVTLKGWLDALPDEVVWGDAELATYQGFILFMTGAPAEAGRYAEAARRNLASDADGSSRGRLLSLQAHVALVRDELEAAIQYGQEALDDLGRDEPLFRSLTANILGQTLEWQGDVTAAVDAYRQGAFTGRQAGDQLGSLAAQVNLAFALNELGHRREAVALCRQVVDEATLSATPSATLPAGRVSPQVEGICVAWSWLSYEGNELDLAAEQAVRALEFCKRVNFADAILRMQAILAQVRLAAGDLEEARRVIQEGLQYADRLGMRAYHWNWFAALAADASMQEGDLGAVARWAEAAGLSADDCPRHLEENTYAIYVRFLLSQKRLEEAETLLATMEHAAQEGGRRRRLITIALQQALVQQAQGQKQAALARIEEALHLAGADGYRRAFLDEGPLLAALLPGVRHVVPAFVDGLLADLAGQVQVPSFETDLPAGLVEPLTEREQQILRLIAAGRSNPEIAQLLYLSLNTIKWHVKNLYGKLGVGSRVEAAARAQELGLL